MTNWYDQIRVRKITPSENPIPKLRSTSRCMLLTQLIKMEDEENKICQTAMTKSE